MLRQPMLRDLRVTSPFGPRGDVVSGGQVHLSDGTHDGVDYSAAIGTTVVAPDDAVVSNINHSPSGALQLFIETVDGRWRFAFVHLDRVLVEVGDLVLAGTDIARTGNTGGVDPHLHVEARDRSFGGIGKLVDPHPLWADETSDPPGPRGGPAAPPPPKKKSAGLLVLGGVVVAGIVGALAYAFSRS